MGTPDSGPTPRRAFTLIELIVVIGIMVVILSAILVAASAMNTKAKVSSTRALLTVVQSAVDEFHREQSGKSALSRNKAYVKRYGLYPPDELEPFSDKGVPTSSGGTKRSIAPGGATVFPPPPYEPMKFYTQGLPFTEAAKEHRDLAAMILAIELYGEASSTILDGIQQRYRTPGVLDDKSEPALFLDRPDPPGSGTPNGRWDASTDKQIRLIVDDWGNPISYLAQRDWVNPTSPGTPAPASSNHPMWNEASTEIVRLNGNRPVIFSYGPDGAEQLSKDIIGSDPTASLVGDFEEASPKPGDTIDHPYNADNVYADPGLKERLTKGERESP